MGHFHKYMYNQAGVSDWCVEAGGIEYGVHDTEQGHCHLSCLMILSQCNAMLRMTYVLTSISSSTVLFLMDP